MKKNTLFKIFVIFSIFIVCFFYYQKNPEKYNKDIKKFYNSLVNYIAPCSKPIYYSFGQIDAGFNISKEELEAISLQVEKIWEDPINKNILQYAEDGDLKINFIFDDRQKSTNELADVTKKITGDQQKYDTLKNKYDLLIAEYETKKIHLEASIKSFNEKQKSYNDRVEILNKRKTITEIEIQNIEEERLALESMLNLLNKEQEEFNTLVNSVNALGNELNYLIKELNIKATYYNNIGESLKDEFQEGEYIRDSSGERINIYEFNNKNKLVRVLAHELGHALGLEHNEDKNSIMYKLNYGDNEYLSALDIADLKGICRIK